MSTPVPRSLRWNGRVGCRLSSHAGGAQAADIASCSAGGGG